MNKQNFEILIRATKEMEHPERFDMSTYVHSTFKEVPMEWCGTPACMLGNLGARSDLQQLLMIDDGCLTWVEATKPADVEWLRYTDPRICAFFDITENEAAELFGPDGCSGAQTRDQALKYVALFMAEHEGTTAAERSTDSDE